VCAGIDDCYKRFDILGARDAVMEASRNCNNWLARIEPWKMKDDRAADRVACVRMAMEAVYVLAHLLRSDCARTHQPPPTHKCIAHA